MNDKNLFRFWVENFKLHKIDLDKAAFWGLSFKVLCQFTAFSSKVFYSGAKYHHFLLY